jgi:serine/threonine-protein kinase RsbW
VHASPTRSAGRGPTPIARRAAAEPRAIPPLRRAVAGLARGGGFPPARVEDIVLAVSEILTNVVVHAYRTARRPGTMDLRAELRGDAVHVTVADEGGGFARRDDSPGLGLGLAIAGMVADDLQIGPERPTGTRVSLRFDRDGGSYDDAGA